jgi:hypothetical protein
MKLAVVLVAAALGSLVAGCSGGDDEALGTTGEEGALHGWSEPTASDAQTALANHADVDPNHVVPRDLLGRALAFHDLNEDRLDNPKYVTVVDFARHSGKRRFFIVDVDSGAVEPHVVAHGSGSDPGNSGYAKKFSNVSGSEMSSLGYYVTAETYQGKHGYSLRLDGVSSTNSRVRDRDVVVHGASYVEAGRSQQGRSNGCFALPDDESTSVIKKIRGGSVIFAERSGTFEDS